MKNSRLSKGGKGEKIALFSTGTSKVEPFHRRKIIKNIKIERSYLE
jgi:hypothetical protein